jgi:hypothetical protein
MMISKQIQKVKNMEKFKLKNRVYDQLESRIIESIKYSIYLIDYSARISAWDSTEARRRLDIWLMNKNNLHEKFRKK